MGLALATSNKDLSNEVHRSITCAFNYVTQQKSPKEALGLLTNIFSTLNSDTDITIKSIENQMMKTFPKLSFDLIREILGEDSDFDYGRQLTEEFVDRLGTQTLPRALINGVPLPNTSLNSNDFEEAVLTEIMQQTQAIQKAVYRGELDDTMVVIDYLMSQPHVMPRLNEKILSTDDQTFLELTGTPFEDLENVQALSQLPNNDMTATLMANLRYFESKSGSEKFLSNTKLHFHSLWVAGDLNTDASKKILKNALKFMVGLKIAFFIKLLIRNSFDFRNLLKAYELLLFQMPIINLHSKRII